MGRFSRLETQPTGAKETAPTARPPREEAERLAAPPGAEAEEPTYDAAYCMRLGDEAFFSGESDDALRWYSRAMKVDNACLEAWAAQIRIMLLERRLSEAKVWITRALSVFPDAPPLIALRGVQHALSGMVRQAMANSDALLSQRGEDATAWLCRGAVLLAAENKHYDFCFRQAMHFTAEDDWRTPFLIALTLDSERRWASAIEYYKQALERRPTLPYAWYRIARDHAELGHKEAARKALRQAAELAGDNLKLRKKIERADAGSLLGRLRHLLRRK